MALASDLISTPLREKGATADRYDFQTMWGLALLFQEHETNEDYAIVFEFHDDVVLLNHSKNPSSVRFFQVKSKNTNGGWTLASLLKRKKSKDKKDDKLKPSYIDKMFDNIHKFSTSVASAYFISNQLCSFNSTKKSFRVDECSEEDFKKIVKSVKEAYPAATDDEVKLLGFTRTDLSLGDATSHTKGKLQSFITQQLGEVWFNPESVYKAIANECRRKAYFSGELITLEQAIKEKGLTKADVTVWLNAIQSNSRSPDWGSIAPQLSYSFAEQLQISHEYKIYRSVVLNTADRAVQRIRMKIVEILPNVISDDSLTLNDMVQIVFEATGQIAVKYLSPYTSAKLKAMIIYEIYTYSKG